MDGPPNYVENHAFQDRWPLSPEAKAAGEAAAGPVRAALDDLRQRRLTQDTVRDALVGLGYTTAQIELRGETQPIDYGIRLPGRGACIHGMVTAGQVSVNVEGPAMEGSCITPQGGH
ncbi:hypothetical protein OG216_09460 [Streptomycetaceae bacterium NBC_01309]